MKSKKFATYVTKNLLLKNEKKKKEKKDKNVFKLYDKVRDHCH